VALNEDMLAQLRAAQEEAARLKQELAQLQQKVSASAVWLSIVYLYSQQASAHMYSAPAAQDVAI
jgi:hypothetical protein